MCADCPLCSFGHSFIKVVQMAPKAITLRHFMLSWVVSAWERASLRGSGPGAVRRGLLVAVSLVVAAVSVSKAARGEAPVYTIDASDSQELAASPIVMGEAETPAGQALTVDGTSLLLDGKRWIPAMGEIHYARLAPEDWRAELLKMKAGGIGIASSYVFWIHHEETEGVWDWQGCRDLRRFVQTCAEVDMPVVIRVGPWCHGEVRNGGLPDWVVEKHGRGVRTTNDAFLKDVDVLYGQIAGQLEGLLWKDGGAVVGLQFDNEYRGRSAYLLALKALAIGHGLEAPLYTRTGWPALADEMPFGEMLPLQGGYAEGFWDRELRSMPGKYWRNFTFQDVRTDAAIATEQLGEREARDEADAQRYPFLTCELGGGMITSYHRRILIDPRDVSVPALVKLGSGSNLPGYYMYHGGTNPVGLTTLNETQRTPTTNWNDMPTKSYEFQSPLGEFGQVREHYHRLRGLHLMLETWGDRIARMRPVLPEQRPIGQSDTDTLRWAVRSDGSSGLLFVSNYQRGVTMPAKEASFEIGFRDGETVEVPAFTVPADSAFVLPLRFEVAPGVVLRYATAQPLFSVRSDTKTKVFFAEIPGVRARYEVEGGVDPKAVGVDLMTMTPEEALKLYRFEIDGAEHVVWTDAAAYLDRGELVLGSSDPEDLEAIVWPPLDGVEGVRLGELAMYRPAFTPAQRVYVPATRMKRAGEPRAVPMGPNKAAESPTDEDWGRAAAWELELPHDHASRDLLLRIRYRGDAARVETLGGELLTDNFYNGSAFDFAPRGFRDAFKGDRLVLRVLPLGAGAPVFFADSVRPSESELPLCELSGVEVIERHEVRIPVTKR